VFYKIKINNFTLLFLLYFAVDSTMHLKINSFSLFNAGIAPSAFLVLTKIFQAIYWMSPGAPFPE